MPGFPRHCRPSSHVAPLGLAPAVSGWEFPLGHSLTGAWHFLSFHFSHSGGCTVLSHCGFNFPSPMTSVVECYFLFLTFITILEILSCEMLPQVSYPFLKNWVFLICMSSLYVLEIYIYICTYIHRCTYTRAHSTDQCRVPSCTNVTVTGVQQ